MCLYVYVCVTVCMCLYVYMCLTVCVSVCVCVYVSVCICVSVCVCCVYVCVSVCACTHGQATLPGLVCIFLSREGAPQWTLQCPHPAVAGTRQELSLGSLSLLAMHTTHPRPGQCRSRGSWMSGGRPRARTPLQSSGGPWLAGSALTPVRPAPG